MPPGALTVQGDGTCTVVPRSDEDTAAFEATLARFSELVCPTAGQRVYRLTAASIWRATPGLTLAEVLQTLEIASTTALPPRSGPIWTLESSDRPPDPGGRPRPPPATRSIPSSLPRCSGIARSGPSSLINAMPPRSCCGPTPIQQWCRPSMPVAIRSWTACPQGGSWRPPQCPAATPLRPVAQPLPAPTGKRQAARVEGLRQLPRQCQATTQAGRRCKNRVQPGSRFCRVHAPWSPQANGPSPVHTAGRPRQPDPGRRGHMWACATATAGGVPGHRSHGPRAPHLPAVAPPDVAPGYGHGKAEDVLGRALHWCQEPVVIATKVRLAAEEMHDVAGAVRMSVEASLRRLRREMVDVLHVHNRFTPQRGDLPHSLSADDALGPVPDAYHHMQHTGKTRFIGISAMEPDVPTVRHIMSSGHFDTVLAYYNLLNWTAQAPAPPGGCRGTTARLSRWPPRWAWGSSASDPMPPAR